MTNLPAMASILNFREMGGLPTADGGVVRHGHLFRSGHLATATDEDLAAIASLGIRGIVDLRTSDDHAADGGVDRVPAGIEHHLMPMVDSSGHNAELRRLLMDGDQRALDERFGGGRAVEEARNGVVVMALEPEKAAVFSGFLRHVAEPANRPVLWHCSAGKDRAGWAATLLGMALGVPDDVLIDHYLESNVRRPPRSRIHYWSERGLDAEIILPFIEVREEYLRTAFAAIDAAYPTRAVYLDEVLGIGVDVTAELRGALVVR